MAWRSAFTPATRPVAGDPAFAADALLRRNSSVRQAPHGCPFPSQLRYHRPHRPRQVDAERPSAGAYRLGDRPRDAGPDPGRYGSGAGARHHHQGPRRAHDVQGPRRQHLPAQPDRYARPCGLQLRGLALAGLLRGRAAGGGRQPGRGGADAGQRLPGHQSRPGNHSRHQQNRPALGRYSRAPRRPSRRPLDWTPPTPSR